MSAIPELKHVAVARTKIGVREYGGVSSKTSNDKIIEMIDKSLVATGQSVSKNEWLRNDKTPWCGSFMGYAFAEAGVGRKIPRNFFRASEWGNAGTKLDKPAYGCVAVFSRAGGGHVGIVVGVTKSGMLKILGGNQGNSVNIMDFDPKRVTNYRWISVGDAPHNHRYELPILPAGTVSKNEA